MTAPPSGAEQIVSGFRAAANRRFAYSHHFADGFQARPLMLFFEPVDLRRHCRRARFDASMIGLDKRRRGACFQLRIVEKQNHVGKQRAPDYPSGPAHSPPADPRSAGQSFADS